MGASRTASSLCAASVSCNVAASSRCQGSLAIVCFCSFRLTLVLAAAAAVAAGAGLSLREHANRTAESRE